MKSLKHFASFDWSAEIDEGHMLFWILNVAAAGPETGPETWLQALKFAGRAPRHCCWFE